MEERKIDELKSKLNIDKVIENFWLYKWNLKII